jgi:phosphoglycolate phosphatase
MRFLHLFFDFDGTLVDSAADIAAAMASAFARHGLPPFTESACLAGNHLPLAGLVRFLAPNRPDLHDAVAASFREFYDGGGLARTSPYPGVVPGLSALHDAGAACSLVTNKRRAPTALVLARMGWTGYFTEVVTSCDLPKGTGKAEALSELLGRRGLDARACVYIGDTDADRVAAQAAGLAFAWVPWGYGQPKADAPGVWCVPRDFGDLTAKLLEGTRT